MGEDINKINLKTVGKCLSSLGACEEDLSMVLWIPKNREELKKHLSDPLFKNAYFLMFSSLTSAGSGFFFWLIAARFYSTADIGLASAIISAMGLISMLSLLGFDISLVRFLPEREDKQELINSCLTISLRRG